MVYMHVGVMNNLFCIIFLEINLNDFCPFLRLFNYTVEYMFPNTIYSSVAWQYLFKNIIQKQISSQYKLLLFLNLRYLNVLRKLRELEILLKKSKSITTRTITTVNVKLSLKW